jgi:release factor glutamine methyltransferase
MSGQEITKTDFHSIPRQSARLEERHNAEGSIDVECYGMKITVSPGVYQTSGDSDLMAESVQIGESESFLEIGCGTGVVSIAVAKRAKNGLGVDINEKAIENSKQNAEMHEIDNVDFLVSNVFENVSGTFSVIICNPPYTRHEVADNVDRMFWDPDDEMKRTFFQEAGSFLKTDGRIYFGWADFADIDVDLPFRLAEENGYELVNTFSKPHGTDFTFYVLVFRPKARGASLIG